MARIVSASPWPCNAIPYCRPVSRLGVCLKAQSSLRTKEILAIKPGAAHSTQRHSGSADAECR
ncbi:hypothetical protein P4C99_07130 [Pontiellaceae bacterium B1224]|nr:hypothetical protein [Pontiellaceae bacterium B1224]